MSFNVKIGTGEILEGSVIGKIHFSFNENGLVVYIPETKQYFSKKNINGISFKTTIRDKIKKGSTLAKTAAFMAATNKNSKNIGSQIATSQRFADMGRDSVVHEEKKITVINIKSLGDLVIDFGSNSDIHKKLVLAYNNPKSFFVQSAKDKKLKAQFFRIIKISFPWVYGFGSVIMWLDYRAVLSDSGVTLLVLVGNILLAYLIYRKKWGKKTNKAEKKISKNDETINFENSEEYKKILKNLS